ncbi:shikimate dehydrogenase [Ramlibacter sp. AW1]|uniref:Shikimate dehydrogenase (NADP(+)) n=1 Tax=Ramlibacter aurantiacus TaxID=2801330 RepID=A0A936ZMV6_9BURK|nr:shikimate dehydrogenase [Ramlibacter aurantiacus]
MAADKFLCGLVGAGIQQSLTPAMQEEEARQQGLRLHYQLIDLDRTPGSLAQLPMLLEAARTIGFDGLNVTFPCKQAVVPLLDELSAPAREMGAVNTVVLHDGRLVGHNTDGSGWAWGLRRALPGADLGRVVLLGAGGAGCAIADALCRMGVGELRIVDADAARAQALAQALLDRFGPRAVALADAAQALHGATGLVHATPTGMAKLPGLAIPASLLRPSMWVSEIVYFPIETDLLRTARALGCRVMDGGAMAVGQAVGAFELFTGRQADAARVERHFRSLVPSR